MKCAAHAHARFMLSGGLATTTLVRLAPFMAMEAVLLGAWCTAVQPAQKMSQTSQSACARSWPARPALRFESYPLAAGLWHILHRPTRVFYRPTLEALFARTGGGAHLCSKSRSSAPYVPRCSLIEKPASRYRGRK